MAIFGEGQILAGIVGAVFFGAIFVGLNLMYFSMTHRVIFKERILDVRFYRTGHFIPYEGVTSMEVDQSGEITVKYRVELGDGRLTSYALPAEFQPEQPQQVLAELRRRVEAAQSTK